MYYKNNSKITDFKWYPDVLEVTFSNGEQVRFNCVKEYEYNMILSANDRIAELRRIISRKPYRVCTP